MIANLASAPAPVRRGRLASAVNPVASDKSFLGRSI